MSLAAASILAQGVSRPAALAAAGLLLVVVGGLDHATGNELGFSIFYLLPVAVAAWHAGRRWGLLVAGASAAVWLALDQLGPARPYSHPAVPYWNAGIRAGYFSIVCLLLARLKAAWRADTELARLKGEMIAMASHEFGNQLAVLGMALTMLRAHLGRDPEKAMQFVETMERTHRLLTGAVSNFLNAIQAESGRLVLRPRRTELRKLVAEILAAMEPVVREKRIEVSRDFPERTVPLEADPDALSLVMANLIGNAVKFTPEGGRVTIRIVAPGPASTEAIVSVEDTGIGIGEEDQKRLFSSFFRTSAGREQAKGYGIGLRLASQLLEGHGSRLQVSSAPGLGSKFYFRLPVLGEGREGP